MKTTGRNLKDRLYGLRNLPSNIKRRRYWRGHGVHSPFVYTIVRQVFMCKTLFEGDTSLYEALIKIGVPERRAVELQNLIKHCQYTSFGIDCEVEQMEGKDMTIASLAVGRDQLRQMAQRATELRSTLCIIAPAFNQERDMLCKELIAQHKCTSVDNRGYLLLFNNHLPKQDFRL